MDEYTEWLEEKMEELGITYKKMGRDKIMTIITVFVAKEYRIENIDTLLSIKIRKNQKIIYARHLLTYLLKKHTNLTLVEISKHINRSHATIMSSLKFIKDKCFIYESYRLYIEIVDAQIKLIIKLAMYKNQMDDILGRMLGEDISMCNQRVKKYID